MSGPDEELGRDVAAAVKGDRASIERLLAEVRPLVVRYCRARVGFMDRGFSSADDVAQEVCLAVLTALPRYKDQGKPFIAFVYGIAAHKVADAHRLTGRNKSDSTADVPDEVSTDGGPEQQYLDAESRARVDRLLSELPDKQREIVVLRLIVGMSAEETAMAVGSTAGAVRVAQHRALAKLRSNVSKAGERGV
ncbi:sigma-70 family RNA polymerase sigma factor [Tomitella biformata]|uniref:sigma-70 family RNA polymerase sigma factor n=1 Tax=Tomitella biformata TaxID=630403 RepID=UPI000466425D|nr:sigma-70 family RNA polymerase sigma factor [Tomitella biformata]